MEDDFICYEDSGYAFISSCGRLSDSSRPGTYCVGNVSGYDSEVAKYGIPCVEGDIIEMELDLNNLTIKYIINGKDYGIAFNNIENCNYRAAVTIDGGGSSITLLC